ncbi:MAG: acetyl-CoA carboxylase biotin carboxyl carrier protein [Planctomycetaceae bacterium]|jgi:acetyl-CoA carboxylase biotin carboxyl carrier protein|nr:acetyl-CoA carboxylase biotin carboxyl carrier protein [Planctomycetaceae bacterium]
MPPSKKQTHQPAPAVSQPCDVFNVERIRSLVELMKENDLSELNLQQGDLTVHLQRTVAAAAVVQQSFVPQTVHSPLQTPVAAAVALPATPSAAAVEDESHIAYVVSPIVGTFYAAPDQKAAPFVKPGDSVTADKVVCIIEAMKVLNEITADVSGKIVAVLVQNGQPVEYGTRLFKIDMKG